MMTGLKQEMRGEFAQRISTLLKVNGFRRGGMNWRRAFSEVVQVVNLQISGHGGQHYLNIGLLLRSIRDDVNAKHYQCNIQTRVEVLSPSSSRQKLEQALDVTNNDFSLTTRLKIVTEVLTEFGLPFCEATKSESDIKKVLSEKCFKIIVADNQTLLKLGLI